MSRNTTSSTVSRSAAGFHLFRFETFIFVIVCYPCCFLCMLFFSLQVFFPVFPFSRFRVFPFVCFAFIFLFLSVFVRFFLLFFCPLPVVFFVEFSWRCAGNSLPFFRSVRRRRFVIKTAFRIPARSGIRWPKGLTSAFHDHHESLERIVGALLCGGGSNS